MKHFFTHIALLFSFTAMAWADPSEPEGRPRSQRPRPRAVQQYFEQLKEKDPEEMKRLQQLRQSDPEAFRLELRKRVQENKGPSFPRHKKRLAEREDYAELIRKTNTPEERQQAITRITEDITKRIDQGLSLREEAIERLRQRLSTLEERHEREKQSRDEMIERQVRKVIQTADREPEQKTN